MKRSRRKATRRGITLLDLCIGIALAGPILVGLIGTTVTTLRRSRQLQDRTALVGAARRLESRLRRDLDKAVRSSLKIAGDGRSLSFRIKRLSPVDAETTFEEIAIEYLTDTEGPRPRSFRFEGAEPSAVGSGGSCAATFQRLEGSSSTDLLRVDLELRSLGRSGPKLTSHFLVEVEDGGDLEDLRVPAS